MADYIERDEAITALTDFRDDQTVSKYVSVENCLVARGAIERAIKVLESLPGADVEKMSDGYHTFADLYEQRLILSATLAKNNPHAWKSKRHEDGSVPFGGGWFIMGFDTDEGCYTYHYELKDWDLFQCEELDKGKPWDGHTSKDVRRLLSIPAADVEPAQEWISVDDRLPDKNTAVIAATDKGIVFQCLYAYDGWDLWDGNEINITHWQPMPQPPKGE